MGNNGHTWCWSNGSGIEKLPKAIGMHVAELTRIGKERESFDQIITYNELPVMLTAANF
ncbi:hypothetical protein [Salipaludibacillus neizhouensis]|uniref:hypothetical protein n=1 Tax=Salipaludibacillus neizhouensis TaxID=885475 RepID=UPI0016032D69|nr:hypothetical protein [Salipaludibacillus neizhouensis]